MHKIDEISTVKVDELTEFRQLKLKPENRKVLELCNSIDGVLMER